MNVQLQEIKNIYIPKIQQIEYLEVNSDHQQYIDTEIKCSSNMTFDLNIYIPQYTARAFWCFGGRDSIIYVNSIHIAYLNNTDSQKKNLEIW